MSGIRALEKLRGLRDEAASKMVDNPRWVCARAEAIADEIEDEVADRFMELPVDADGVPIRPGDDLYDKNTGELIPGECVYGVGDRYAYIWHEGHDLYHGITGRYPDQFRHRPRTVEDVLKELEGMRGNNATYEDVVVRCSELAAEIRELMGGTE